MVSSYGFASGEAEPTDDMPMAKNTSSRFDAGRNFCNKLWNAVRFALTNLEASEDSSESSEAGLIDRWIVSRLHRTQHVVEEAIGNYQFNVYADAMYELVWKDFCDWYLEGIKPTVRDNPAQQATLHAVLDSIIRMLHPVCPFVTETLWPHLHRLSPGEGVRGVELPSAELCARAAWPSIACSTDDKEAEEIFGRAQSLVLAIRNLRGERQVKPSRRIHLHAPANVIELINASEGVIETMAGIGSGGGDDDVPGDAIPIAFEGGQVMLSDLVDAVDMDKERARLAKVVEQKQKQVEGLSRRLDNPNYVQKAKPELVEETRQMLASAQQDLSAAQAALEGLG